MKFTSISSLSKKYTKKKNQWIRLNETPLTLFVRTICCSDAFSSNLFIKLIIKKNR